MKRTISAIIDLFIGKKRQEFAAANIVELRALFYKYKSMPAKDVNPSLETEIDAFLSAPEMIKDLILSPSKYINGKALRHTYIKDLELFYAVACLTGRLPARDKIFAFLYEVYKELDSLHLQESYADHFNTLSSFNKEKDKQQTDKLFNVIEYFYEVNLKKLKKISSAREAKAGEKLIRIQQKIIYLLIMYGSDKRKRPFKEMSYPRSLFRDASGKEKYGPFVSQLFSAEYANIHNTFSSAVLCGCMSKKDREKFHKFLGAAKSDKEVLRYITENGIPYEIGCFFIMAISTAPKKYEIFKDEGLGIKFRYYALLTLARKDKDEESLMVYINNKDRIFDGFLRMLGTADKKKIASEFDNFSEIRKKSEKVPLVSEECKAALQKESINVIGEILSEDIKTVYFNNIKTELLLTALTLKASEFGDVDIFKSLNKMPEVISFKNNEDGCEIMEGNRGLLLLCDAGKRITKERLFILAQYLKIFLIMKDSSSDVAETVEKLKNALNNTQF